MSIDLKWIASISLASVAFLWQVYNWFKARARYTEILYDYNIMETTNSAYTQIAFVNKGTIPATDVKLRIRYPPNTKIDSISPPLKWHESNDKIATVIELNIMKMDARPRPFTLAILTDKAPDENFEIQVHENKGVRMLPYN